MAYLIAFVRISKPILLLVVALLYMMGTGIARYLGIVIDWNIFILGLLWIGFVQLSSIYLNEYFYRGNIDEGHKRSTLSGGLGAIGIGVLPKTVPLIAGFTVMTFAASISVVLFRMPGITPTTLFTFIAFLVLSLLLVLPPARFVMTGYGEIISSITISFLVPTAGFLMQSGELHRLVAMLSFPLVFQQFAMILAGELPSYAQDIKYENRTLMVRAGWEAGMRFHNISLFLAYLVLSIALIFGLPLSIGLPAFLTFPLAIYQIWTMLRIANGAKPNWRLLILMSGAIFGLTAYLITFTLWIR